MSRLSLSAVAAAVLVAVMATPARVSAISDGTYDKLTYLTFSGPVQIPGATLAAGTYRFRLTNPETSRNVLQVLSNDGAIVYSMFHTIHDSRTELTENSMVTFRETPAGVAPAVRSLFYGGEYRGYEFIYPGGEPNMLAEIAWQPPITFTPFPAALAAPEPVAEAAPEPVAAPEPAPAEPAVEPEPAPATELPRTATLLPLVGAGGLTSLLAALGLGLLRRRLN